ncbi:DUF6417 family protein [Streptomyces yokosukanensis]|nr:DUF6417 family protein [Streptomyces yokosukanensis]
MRGRKSWLEAMRVLRHLEKDAEWGWVLVGELLPRHQRAAQAAAEQGLVELAGRETRAELSAYEDRPVRWAARLSPQGHDVLTFTDAGPAPASRHEGLAGGEMLIELYRAELEALSLYVHLAGRLRVPPAEGLADRVRTARQLGNRWSLWLTPDQIESVAYAFYLRSMGGCATQASRFAREYGLAFLMDPSEGCPRLTRLPGTRCTLPDARVTLTDEDTGDLLDDWPDDRWPPPPGCSAESSVACRTASFTACSSA